MRIQQSLVAIGHDRTRVHGSPMCVGLRALATSHATPDSRKYGRGHALLLLLVACARGALLLDEDFSCASIGCNATHGITNYTFWRWSTTGSAQASMTILNASGRPGNEVDFGVEWCAAPSPNPRLLGCYRSELALQRDVQDTLVDWKAGVGSSERWFGFSNRLMGYAWDSVAPLNGPSLQLHGGGGLPRYKGMHPVLNLQVDATGCAAGNTSCPRWTVSVSNGGPPDPRCPEAYSACFDLGSVAVNGSLACWNDFVVRWRGSPTTEGAVLAVYRGGELVLPPSATAHVATAYNDTVAPYLKFGVYRGQWKERLPRPPRAGAARVSTIAYGALKVGDAASSFAEVDTRPAQ